MNSKIKEAIETLKWYINNEMGGYERQICLNALTTATNQPMTVDIFKPFPEDKDVGKAAKEMLKGYRALDNPDKEGLFVPYEIAMQLIVMPQPDPKTDLVPCGCGGRAVFEGSFLDEEVPSSYRVSLSCVECGISTIAYEYEQEAMKDWNRAMGYHPATLEKQPPKL